MGAGQHPSVTRTRHGVSGARRTPMRRNSQQLGVRSCHALSCAHENQKAGTQPEGPIACGEAHTSCDPGGSFDALRRRCGAHGDEPGKRHSYDDETTTLPGLSLTRTPPSGAREAGF